MNKSIDCYGKYRKRKVKDKNLYLFDIDGTLLLGDKVIDGCREIIEEINKQGKKYIFITNNSTKTAQEYVKKFRSLGIETKEENFITAFTATINYLKKNFKRKKVFLLGTKSLKEELERNDIIATDKYEEDICCALASFDTELTYKKLEDICRVLRNDSVTYLATNPDMVCPVENGYIPDCGSICSMIENAVKRKPIYIGKPNTLMIEISLKETNTNKEDAIIIGDRLNTDILCGLKSGVDTAAVFTGETNKEEIEASEYKPTHIFNSVKDIYKLIKV